MAVHEETAVEKADRQKFEAEDDVRTLVRASEIRSDKARLKRATAMAKKQLQTLKEIT